MAKSMYDRTKESPVDEDIAQHRRDKLNKNRSLKRYKESNPSHGQHLYDQYVEKHYRNNS